MRKDKKHGQFRKISTVFVALFAWVALPFVLQQVKAGNEVPIVVRTANLASPTGSVNPHGAAEWQLYPSGNRELEVEIEDVNLPAGTSLAAVVDGATVGQIVLAADQRGRLKLRTEDGQPVPVTNDGSTVQVRNGATVLVAGVLGGGGPNPSPSPSATATASPTATATASPTGSPTGSPTATPTASPTASPTGSPSPSPTGSPNESEIYAILSGATINGALPRGFAQYEIHSSRTEIEVNVYQVNLQIGTPLGVFINNAQVGNLLLASGGEGRLRLRSDRGENVPVVTPGTTIQIRNGAATVLSGTFSAAGSPTPSPTGTPNQGRYFEGKLNGAGVTPPVATNAIGEIKVLLNAAETQATITGEFNRFTSAQTSARIFVTVNGTTTVVADLGTVPSPEGEGRFTGTTVNVTAQQVQLLRMGSWTAVIGSAANPNGEIQGRILNDSRSADFDGDGSNDLAVFRPSTGVWYSQNGQGFGASAFGSASDLPVSADYDGDGKTDRAVFRNAGGAGVWDINNSSDGSVTSLQFGLASDVPVRGDFDGDGRSDIAVFRPETGVWYVQKSNNSGFIIVQFGTGGDVPMAADMDGDGRRDITVFRPSTGVWYWIQSSNGQIGIVGFGTNGDKPVQGDFDGDGRDDVSVYRPSTGVWYILKSSGGYDIRQFGIGEDVPVAGNYDGDNKTDIAVFRPSTGVWYIWRSVDNTFDFRSFGLTGDVPTAR